MQQVPLKRILAIGYFGGCGVYTVAQSIETLVMGYRSLDWLAGSAMHALVSPWWPLLLTYAYPFA
jgi:hypothetical protein